ncbi:MAG: hypothetical protein HZC40_26610 [Chloroflexi bacterium]|nr:hypothetical protein [Chloroflexota bacterium]
MNIRTQRVRLWILLGFIITLFMAFVPQHSSAAESSPGTINSRAGFGIPNLQSTSTPTATPTPTGALLAYWKMEEGSGTRVMDSAGRGHNQNFVSAPGNPTWSTDVPTLSGGNARSMGWMIIHTRSMLWK